MGQSLSQVINETEKNRELEKAHELRKTERTMQQKLEEKKSKLYIDALNDECIPIACAVDKFYDFLVDIKREALSVGIRSKIDKHLRGKYLEKLLTLLENVLNSLLDMETTAAPFETEQKHVVYANKSVIRIDYYIYFESSVKEVETSALFYFVQVGVIDMARARPQVLIYELTRATKGKKLKDAGSKLKKIADSTGYLNDAVQTLTRAAREENRVPDRVTLTSSEVRKTRVIHPLFPRVIYLGSQPTATRDQQDRPRSAQF